MKHRPSKRVVWLIVPLVPVALMSGLFWYAGQPDAGAIATRGAQAPPKKKFSLMNPGSWGASADWFDDGMESLGEWQHNPWRYEWRHGGPLGRRMNELEKSGRPEDKADLERLKKLGREWYERILARYPDLAVRPDREIPREENGYLQWKEFVDRMKGNKTGLFDTAMSPGLAKHFERRTDPDMEEVNRWLEANRARIDEIREIGLLPGHSSAGVVEYQKGDFGLYWAREAAQALLLDARAAITAGEMGRALESIRAAGGLADHVSGTGATTLLGSMTAGYMRFQVQDYVLHGLFPSAPAGSIDLAKWQQAMGMKLRPPTEVANSLRVDWNSIMPQYLLPVLSDNADSGTPRDADHLAETYTRHIQALIRQADGVSLADYAAATRVETSTDYLSRRSRETGVVNRSDPQAIFLIRQETTGLALAAFAIMNGQPVPLDPVYGRSYKWDTATRTLEVPDVPTKRWTKIKPVKVPKM